MADKTGKRRRSSSILQVYHEPPEPIKQLSDQAKLPNLNVAWSMQKAGCIWALPHAIIRRDAISTRYLAAQTAAAIPASSTPTFTRSSRDDACVPSSDNSCRKAVDVNTVDKRSVADTKGKGAPKGKGRKGKGKGTKGEGYGGKGHGKGGGWHGDRTVTEKDKFENDDNNDNKLQDATKQDAGISTSSTVNRKKAVVVDDKMVVKVAVMEAAVMEAVEMEVVEAVEMEVVEMEAAVMEVVEMEVVDGG
ncbi:hypothetical protein C7999DRAFT_36668, partial [Corynascus novoguineensis]